VKQRKIICKIKERIGITMINIEKLRQTKEKHRNNDVK